MFSVAFAYALARAPLGGSSTTPLLHVQLIYLILAAAIRDVPHM
jgi:hypothetical protein